MCTRLPPQVQNMLEARSTDERRACAFALEQRVRRDGRPVAEATDRLRAHRPRCRDDRLLLPARGRDLRRTQLTAVEEHSVGERPTDVDAEDLH